MATNQPIATKQSWTSNKSWTTNKRWNCTPNHNPITSNSKKRKHGLCDKQRPARKHRLNHSHQLRRTNYGNIIIIRRTTENSTALQADPAGNVINLSNNHFTTDVYKLLNKNLNSVPTIKKFSEKLLDEEVNDFYQHIKLKAHFRDRTQVKEQTEEEIFKKPTNKKWHCAKSVKICKVSKSPYSVRIQENTDHKILRIWTLFTQCGLQIKIITIWADEHAHASTPTYPKNHKKH